MKTIFNKKIKGNVYGKIWRTAEPWILCCVMLSTDPRTHGVYYGNLSNRVPLVVSSLLDPRTHGVTKNFANRRTVDLV